MIIGVTGKMGSGKDTFYKMANKHISFAERRAFADKLKESAAALLGCTSSDLNEWKLDKDLHISGGHWDYFNHSPLFTWSFREFLQRYGTEAHREIFGENFWLEQCLPLDDDYRGKLIIVTDVRFNNEAKWVRDLGGIVIQVIRPTLDSGDVHASEVPIDPSLVTKIIMNDGTLENYEDKIKGALYEYIYGG
jgi:hypothetical protein